jgi:hypothetical protein
LGDGELELEPVNEVLRLETGVRLVRDDNVEIGVALEARGDIDNSVCSTKPVGRPSDVKSNLRFRCALVGVLLLLLVVAVVAVGEAWMWVGVIGEDDFEKNEIGDGTAPVMLNKLEVGVELLDGVVVGGVLGRTNTYSRSASDRRPCRSSRSACLSCWIDNKSMASELVCHQRARVTIRNCRQTSLTCDAMSACCRKDFSCIDENSTTSCCKCWCYCINQSINQSTTYIQ